MTFGKWQGFLSNTTKNAAIVVSDGTAKERSGGLLSWLSWHERSSARTDQERCQSFHTGS